MHREVPVINIINSLKVHKLRKNAALLVASITAMLCLVACGSDPELKTLGHTDTILAFGDSLTAGLGVSAHKAYPDVLQALSDRSVFNAGVSGELTEEGLKRLPGLLDKHDPQLVILLEGGNDILQNRSLAATKANLSAMIDLIKAQERDVILVGVPTKSLFAGTAKLYVELAKEHQIPLEKDIIGSLLKQSSMKSDSVHFNRGGYSALAETLLGVLQNHGAL